MPFSEQPLGILSSNFTHLLRVDSLVKMPKAMLLSSTTTKLLEFLHNHIVISHVHKQRNVCKMNGTPRLHLTQTHYYSNNITNNLEVTLRNSYVHCRFSHMHLFSSLSKVFNNFVDGKLSEITCSACLSLATDFSFSEKLLMNITAN